MKTKYKKGDKFYILMNDKIVIATVIKKNNKFSGLITCNYIETIGDESDMITMNFDESELFKSKYELAESLLYKFKDITI